MILYPRSWNRIRDKSRSNRPVVSLVIFLLKIAACMSHVSMNILENGKK